MSGTSSESSEPSSIAIGESIIQIGRSSRSTMRLSDLTVSRNHATVQRDGDGFKVVDLESRFGTFVNGLRIRSARARVGDKIQFGTSVVCRVTPTGLEVAPNARGLEILAERIRIVRGQYTLLTDISVSIHSDAFVGILGPSGAGKSLLLKCLASHWPPTDGHIVFDGQYCVAEYRDHYRAMLGHVPQDDIIYQSLTVSENLKYAAKLRLGREVDSEKIRNIIGRALDLVALTDHKEKPVSVLSGGQRKRLSVAIELLRQPRLLLLDEPTSGLDPASETHLMERLHHVASCGTTVVCTTHLMDNIRLLDTAIVLGIQHGIGRLAYVGTPHDLLKRFHCKGFADLYEKLEEGEFDPCDGAGEPSSTASDSRVAQREPGRTPSLKDVTPVSAERLAEGGLMRLIIPAEDDTTLRQSSTVFGRELTMLGRDRTLGMMMVAQPTILGLIVCLTQFNLDLATPLFFFSVVLAIWFGLNNSARDLVRQRKQYVRERLAGLRPEAYLSAKFMLFMVAGAVQLALMVLVMRIGSLWIFGERIPPELHNQSNLGWLLVLLLSYLGGLGLGFLASSLAPTEESAVAIIPLLIIPQLLISVVALGEANNGYDQNRPLRPLAVTVLSPGKAVRGDQYLSGYANLVDFLSMPLYSRPATLVLDGGRPLVGFGRWIWIGDFSHLIILVAVTWMCVYLVFLRVEREWPRLIGY